MSAICYLNVVSTNCWLHFTPLYYSLWPCYYVSDSLCSVFRFEGFHPKALRYSPRTLYCPRLDLNPLRWEFGIDLYLVVLLLFAVLTCSGFSGGFTSLPISLRLIEVQCCSSPLSPLQLHCLFLITPQNSTVFVWQLYLEGSDSIMLPHADSNAWPFCSHFADRHCWIWRTSCSDRFACWAQEWTPSTIPSTASSRCKAESLSLKPIASQLKERCLVCSLWVDWTTFTANSDLWCS